MSAQPWPDGDELRARALLRALHARPFGHSADSPRRTTMTAPDEEPPWWAVGKDPSDDEKPDTWAVAPGVHIEFTPPPTPEPVDTRALERRSRARRWLLTHGAAAGVGWTLGLYHSIAAGLDALGPGAPAAGLAGAGMAWVAAEMVTERYGRVLPAKLRPAAAWVLRIPFATALLATALHAPNALI